MSKKEDALFNDWVKEIESKLASKPGKLANFKAFIADDEDEIGREVFRGAHRGEDYYRRLNEHNEEVKEFEKREADFQAAQAKFGNDQRALYDWYEQAKPVNARLQQEKADLTARLVAAQEELKNLGLEDEAKRIGVLRAETRGVQDSAEMAEVQKQLRLIQNGLPGLLTQVSDVTLQIAKNGWNVTPQAVIDYSAKNGVDLNTAFSKLTEGERSERSNKEFEDKLKAAKEEGRREALAGKSAPDFHRPSGPSIVDSLRDQDLTDPGKRRAAILKEFIAMDTSQTAQ